MSSSGGRWVFALLVWLPGVAGHAQDAALALRVETTVQGETVRLADLLSLQAPAAARLAAEKIILGRAPEPGSVRVFPAAELRHVVAGQMAVEFPALAVVRGAGWPL